MKPNIDTQITDLPQGILEPIQHMTCVKIAYLSHHKQQWNQAIDTAETCKHVQKINTS